LTILGEPKESFLIECIPTAPTNECRNLATALAAVKTSAVAALIERAGAEPDPVIRARFATVLLALGAPRAAGESLALAADPIHRVAFIHNFEDWHGDLSGLPDLVRGSDAPAFRSGMALALGSIDPRTLARAEREALTRALLDLFRSDPDRLTHAAADWALRRWKVQLPTIPTSHEPHAGWHWFVNGRGMTMMEVAPGVGIMGDTTVKGSRPHTIALSRPYFMCDREVWVDLFWEFIADPDYPADDKPQNWPGPSVETSPTADCPVNNTSWQEAILFCNWLSHKEWRTPCYERVGKGADGWRCNFDADGYRLPTEAEWEYACRAGTTTHFAFGDQPDLLTRYGNVTAMRAVAGGTYLPNDWGLFDMLGNIWEWCWDGKDAPFAPFVLDPVTPAQGPTRVARGGAFGAGAYYCRSAFRFPFAFGSRNDSYGFRVVCGMADHDPSGGRRIDRLERMADALSSHPEARTEVLALRTTCGRWHAGQGLWDEAAADFASVIAAKAGDEWSPASDRVSPGAGTASDAELIGWDRGFARDVALKPDDPQPRLAWARFYAELSLWDLAAARASEAFEPGPDSLTPWERMAVLFLAAGDPDAYRRHCALMIERFGHDPHPTAGWPLAIAASLGPKATDDPSLLANWSEAAIALKPRQVGPLFAAGLAHFRAGRFEQAVRRLNEAVTLNPNLSTAFFVLAMAHHRLGHPGEVRRWMEKADRWWDGALTQALKNPDGRPPVPFFLNWARVVVLRDEAKRMIGGTVPPIDPRLRVIQNRNRARLGLPPVPDLPDDVFAHPAGAPKP
jgi:formylglycine-generating enzyme required for sulfatase activity/tetratricopeptide (TPR) repeat protein